MAPHQTAAELRAALKALRQKRDTVERHERQRQTQPLRNQTAENRNAFRIGSTTDGQAALPANTGMSVLLVFVPSLMERFSAVTAYPSHSERQP